MCGILRVLKRGPVEPDRERIEGTLQVLAHRGPDGKGVIVERFDGGTLVLAHRRLSVIDPTDAGAQPMSYRDGRGWVTYNGELYNYVELRDGLATNGEQFSTRSDTEALLAALHRWGPRRALEKFSWMGAFAWFDRDSGRLESAERMADSRGCTQRVWRRQSDCVQGNHEQRAAHRHLRAQPQAARRPWGDLVPRHLCYDLPRVVDAPLSAGCRMIGSPDRTRVGAEAL
jgi:Glutamine amidotransferase domain